MVKMFTETELRNIRDRAEKIGSSNLSSRKWREAYLNVAKAIDVILDAAVTKHEGCQYGCSDVACMARQIFDLRHGIESRNRKIEELTETVQQLAQLLATLSVDTLNSK